MRALRRAVKTEMLRRNGPIVKSVESVLRLEGSLWWERFVKEVDFDAGVKERGRYLWWEWWVGRVRRCGRSMNRQDRDRGAEMRLTERTRKWYTCTYHGHLHYYPGCQCRLLRYKTYFIHFTNQIATSPINKRRGPTPQRTSYRQQNRTCCIRFRYCQPVPARTGTSE